MPTILTLPPLSFPPNPIIPQERGFHPILRAASLWNSHHRWWGFLYEESLILRSNSSLFGLDTLKFWEHCLFLKSLWQVYCFNVKSCLKWQKWMLILSFSLHSYCNSPIVSSLPSATWIPQAAWKKAKCETQIFLRILLQLHSHLTAMGVCIFSMTLICKYCFYFFFKMFSYSSLEIFLSHMPLMSF